jgi:hypothetical protein
MLDTCQFCWRLTAFDVQIQLSLSIDTVVVGLLSSSAPGGVPATNLPITH